MHPLPVQIQHDLTRGTDREKAPRRERERERDIRYRHVRRTMRLALISNRPPGSLMCPVYSTDTQLPGTFNQILIQYIRSDIAGNTTNRISKTSRALAGIEPGTSGLAAQHVTDWAIPPLIYTDLICVTWLFYLKNDSLLKSAEFWIVFQPLHIMFNVGVLYKYLLNWL